ncbi:hypothetical protein [Streptomyces sp. MP131-18]|uniref:hypothetical protein n=1 Tax=Streptomyces sp. MP131-18 TaxID=1857892 RepID=UPI00097C7CC2|nr:hypothetical protein [Streptomyces sp. MP131-18]ONK11062.1 Protein-L-isoaspartate O-methyltransferase [Streptomyces sp. MP131-18]
MTTVTSAASAADLRRTLVDRLAAGGHLDPQWRDAFLHVPHEAFFREAEPDCRDDAPAADGPGARPSVLAAMLGALGPVARGTRVLQVGTGRGHGTALLCHRAGEAAVTSLAPGPEALAPAREALARAGYAPTLAVGAPAAGHPGGAPYDALIAGVDVPRVPAAWLAQVRPGGTVVAALGFALAALTVAADGSATGPLLPVTAAFADAPADASADARQDPAGPLGYDVGMVLSLRGQSRVAVLPDLGGTVPRLLRHLVQPDVTQVTLREAEKEQSALHILTHRPSGSWARVVPRSGGFVHVDHAGPRDVFGEFAPVVSHWAASGRPGPEAYGLTVSADGGHTLWSAADDGFRRPLARC